MNKVTITQRLEGENANLMLPTEITIDAVVYKDGDQWCCLVGNNIQSGCAGFGKSPQQAIQNCSEECGMLV